MKSCYHTYSDKYPGSFRNKIERMLLSDIGCRNDELERVSDHESQQFECFNSQPVWFLCHSFYPCCPICLINVSFLRCCAASLLPFHDGFGGVMTGFMVDLRVTSRHIWHIYDTIEKCLHCPYYGPIDPFVVSPLSPLSPL